MPTIDQLRKYPLFSGLTQEELDSLSAGVTKRSFAKDAHIYYPGSPCVNIYLVESGLVRLFFNDARGSEYLINLVRPGGVVGLPLLPEGQVRLMGAATQQPSTLLIIHGEDLSRLMRTSSQFCLNIYTELASTSRKLFSHYQALVSFSLEGRFAVLLLHLSGDRDEFDLPISQAELATWLGASRGRLNRTLSNFLKRGLIRMQGQKVIILDRGELLRLSEGAILTRL